MSTSPDTQLLIDGPDSTSGTQETPTLSVDAAEPIKFDALGPLVVNSDGTLSRIANWQEMTEPERARTLRILVKRNQIRLADQQIKLDQAESATQDTSA